MAQVTVQMLVQVTLDINDEDLDVVGNQMKQRIGDALLDADIGDSVFETSVNHIQTLPTAYSY